MLINNLKIRMAGFLMGKDNKINKKINNNYTQNIKNKLKLTENSLVNGVFIYLEDLTVSEFSKITGVSAIDVIKFFFKEKITLTQDSMLDSQKLIDLCIEFDFGFKKAKKITAENLLEDLVIPVNEKKIEKRPPIITIMGHIDHGKTTLLDKIRKSRIVNKEKGGITQHIGAYQVITPKEKKIITFIDTPGHSLFSEMRARGSVITDIIIIVVSGEESIKAQTIEAVELARSAKVPMIVFVNKSDKPNFNFEKVKQDFQKIDVLPEDSGGEVPFLKGSAKTGEGIQEILEYIILFADVLELKADFNTFATGVVIESKLDKFLGNSVTLLVRSGTLRLKDLIIAGVTSGKIKMMKNDLGKLVKKATPSTPVQVFGLNDLPYAGDVFMCLGDEKLSKKISTERKKNLLSKIRNSTNKTSMSLEDINEKIKEGKLKTINIILKADTSGSLEAIKSGINKIEFNNIKFNIINSKIGPVTDTDISLAQSSNSIIYAFNVRKATSVKINSFDNINIRFYTIIYKLLENIEDIAKGILISKIEEKVNGHAEVRNLFKHSKIGTIAGCYVLDGVVIKTAKIRVLRGGIIIYNGEIKNLKHEKNDKKEIKEGIECGITLHQFNDLKINDIIESYSLIEVKR